jgi:hypothetical protein
VKEKEEKEEKDHWIVFKVIIYLITVMYISILLYLYFAASFSISLLLRSSG